MDRPCTESASLQGATVYSPLKQYGAGPGKNVGVVGLGGLGHFAVLFGKPAPIHTKRIRSPS